MEPYKELFNNLISNRLQPLIVKYDPINDIFDFQPIRHDFSLDFEDRFIDVLFDNIVFYAYEKDEILADYEDGNLNNLREAAKAAYIKRIPKTESETDGLLGELSIDAFLKVLFPETQTLISRVKYMEKLAEHDVKREVKGYDAIFFSIDESKNISIWLGQVKTGKKKYCLDNIKNDLNKNIIKTYFSGNLLLIADLTKGNRNIALLEVVKDLNKINLKIAVDKQSQAVIDYFKSKNIVVKMPAMVIYSADNYEDHAQVLDEIKTQCINELSPILIKNEDKLNIEIVFLLFPVRDLKSLREKLLNVRLNTYKAKV